VHEHLKAKVPASDSVSRVRTYVCPHCDEPVENRRVIQKRLAEGLKDVICPACEKRVVLVDLIEEKFGSDEFLRRVREMDERAGINLDNESRELILVGHAYAVAGEAGQIYRQYGNSDHGIDGEIEFKNAGGKRLYLQLKVDDSYVQRRKEDGTQIFEIRNRAWAAYWMARPYPVMLVVRGSDGRIRWMDVTEYLRRHGAETRRIVVEGEMEPFTAPNVARMREG
jgi:hypothetical protein